MEEAELVEDAGLGRGNFLRRVSTVEYTEQTTHGLQAHGVRVALKKAAARAEFRHEPHPDQANLHPMGVIAQGRSECGPATRLLDEKSETLLRVGDLQQPAPEQVLMLQQRGSGWQN
jgi:hypothetical protein